MSQVTTKAQREFPKEFDRERQIAEPLQLPIRPPSTML